MKNAISRDPQGEESQAFWSCFFLVPKKQEGMSQQIMDRPFHMLAIRQGLKCVFPGQLVHLDQAKRGFFPFLHHPEAQEVLVLG